MNILKKLFGLAGAAADATPVGAVLSIGSTLIDRLVPDPKAAAAAKLQLLELQQKGELQQLADQHAQNLAQAANVKAGWQYGGWLGAWPGAVGWAGAFAVIWHYVAYPLMAFAFPAAKIPVIDTADLLHLLLSMMGLGGFHFAHKMVRSVKGQAS